MSVFVLIVVVVLSGGMQHVYSEIAPDLDNCLAAGADLRNQFSVPGTLFLGTSCVQIDLPPEAFSKDGASG